MNKMATISIDKKENKDILVSFAKTSYNSSNSVINFVAGNMSSVGICSNVITAQNSNYQTTKQRLHDIDDISLEDDEDDWGVTRPTTFAWKNSLKILEEIKQEIENLKYFGFPVGFASLDSDGGIELIWKNHATKNEVRVSIPSHEGNDISVYIRNLGNGESKLFTISSVNQVVRALQFLYQ